MFINGEYEDAMGRATNSLTFKNNTAGAIMSMFADNGRGHFDYSDRVCEYLGMYLRKIGQYRLPASAAADGTAVLQTIDPSTQGWLADRWRKGLSPTASPAPVASYSGNASEAFWFFDQEHAETTHNNYLPVKTTYQLVGYTQNGSLVAMDNSHAAVNLSWSPDATGDGRTFRLGSTFLDIVPSQATGAAGLPAGSAIGHASSGGPVLIHGITGPFEQLSPDTFRIAFNRIGTENLAAGRSKSIWFQATHPGDATYVSAVQQAVLGFTLPLTSGTAQTITFTQPADQLNGISTLPIVATTSGSATYAGATVSFYVREGPAKIIAGTALDFTPLPPRTKFPVKVTVVATQYGRTIAPLLQTATPVTRTFWIHKNAVEKWRYDTFGSVVTGSNGELQWSINETTSADSGDADGDGVPNLNEYAFGLNAGINDGNVFTTSGTTLTSRGLPQLNVETQPTSVTFTARFVRRKTYASDGLIYTPQFSADLSTWINSSATPTVVASDATHEAVEVPYPFFINGKKARFFRMMISTTP